MRDLDRIRAALAEANARGEGVVLATVMSVEGSTYRGAGARMVVTSTGTSIGAVSGGCLEADIVARSASVRERGTSELVRYDTRSSDDVVLGLGLGCQGVVDVLLEPLSGYALRSATAFYDRLAAHRSPVTLVTALDAGDSVVPMRPRAVLDEKGGIIDGHEHALDASDPVRETINPATRLVVFGAGTDAMPLVHLAGTMGWHATVVDHRALLLTPARFPNAGALVCADPAEMPPLPLDRGTAVVVMAHSAMHDRAWLRAALDADPFYVGVLGPRRRTLELLGERAPSGEMPAAILAPVGLDIGAESPEEIALAIVAEIMAATTRRHGGMLRERRGPIHDRPDALAPMQG